MSSIPANFCDISVEWLNNVLPSESKIIRFELTKVSEEGEGYLSSITGAILYREDGISENIVIKMKRIIMEDYVIEMEYLGRISEREIIFYNDVTPLITASTAPIPRCFYAKKTDANFSNYAIITENLKSQNFQIANLAGDSLSFEQVSSALQALGRCHACFVAIRSKIDEYPIFDEKYITEAIEPNVDYALDKLKNYTSEQKQSNLQAIILNHRLKCKTRKQFVYDGLRHGDFWCNNVLFRSDGEARIIDWQLSTTGPLTADIATFFLTTTSCNFWKRNQYKLLEKYYSSFRGTLDEVGHPADEYTFETLKSEYDETILDGLSVTVSMAECFLQKGNLQSRIMDLIDEFATSSNASS